MKGESKTLATYKRTSILILVIPISMTPIGFVHHVKSKFSFLSLSWQRDLPSAHFCTQCIVAQAKFQLCR